MHMDATIEAEVREALAKWPGYKPSDKVLAGYFGDRKLFLGYNVEAGGRDWLWAANVIDGIFYLLTIQIPESMRGKGLGHQLYEILIEIARQRGCREIRQTPSGTTTTGESRRQYLERRGWESDGVEVMKRLGGVRVIPE